MNQLFLLSNDGWALILLAICIIPIAALIIFAIVKAIVKGVKKHNKSLLNDPTVDESQKEEFLNAYGGSDNVLEVAIERQKITVKVKDIEKVQGEELKNLGASGVLLIGNEVRASFSDRAQYVYDLIK
ncbi:MAG: hypothetical protein J6Y42_00965 [Bacilli bacterium]|nr:hypothetical protein [Bacilli bacterium]